MRFLVDAQLPPGFAVWLTERGYDAVHVRAVSLTNAEDAEIWEYAIENDMMVVTKDEDFAARSARSIGGPIVVWLRIGNSTNPVLFAWIEERWQAIVTLLGEGNRLIEVR